MPRETSIQNNDDKIFGRYKFETVKLSVSKIFGPCIHPNI